MALFVLSKEMLYLMLKKLLHRKLYTSHSSIPPIGSLAVTDRSVENNILSCLFLSGTYLLCQTEAALSGLSLLTTPDHCLIPLFHCTQYHYHLIILIYTKYIIPSTSLRQGLWTLDLISLKTKKLPPAICLPSDKNKHTD